MATPVRVIDARQFTVRRRPAGETTSAAYAVYADRKLLQTFSIHDPLFDNLSHPRDAYAVAVAHAARSLEPDSRFIVHRHTTDATLFFVLVVSPDNVA